MQAFEKKPVIASSSVANKPVIAEELEYYSQNLKEANEVDDILHAVAGATACMSSVLDSPNLLTKDYNFTQFVDAIRAKLDECQQAKDKTEDQYITLNFYKMFLQSKEQTEEMKKVLKLEEKVDSEESDPGYSILERP
jgi:hypothetical protein